MTSTTRRALSETYLAETRIFLREPIAIFFTFAFPLLLVLIIGTSFGESSYAPDEVNPYPGLRTIDLFVPTMFGIAAANLGLLGLPAVFAGYREAGILRRYRASPMSFTTLFAAHILVQFTMLIAISILLVAVVIAGWGLRFPGSVPAMAVVFLLAAVLMFSIGLMLSGVVRTGRQAQAVGAAIFFPGMFLSGATFPLEKLPAWLRGAAEFLPMTPMVRMLDNVWAAKPFDAIVWPLLLVVCFTVAALLIARSTFRWE